MIAHFMQLVLVLVIGALAGLQEFCIRSIGIGEVRLECLDEGLGASRRRLGQIVDQGVHVGSGLGDALLGCLGQICLGLRGDRRQMTAVRDGFFSGRLDRKSVV